MTQALRTLKSYALCFALLLAMAQWALGGPSIAANVTAAGVELGASLSLYELVYSSTGPVSYQWSLTPPGGTVVAPISGAVSQTYTFASASSANAGTYSITVTDLTGPTTATVAIITVDPPTAPIFVTQPQNENAVFGQPISFFFATTGSLPQTFQWFLNGQAIPGATGNSYTINAVDGQSAGTLTAVATNVFGSTPSAAATLVVTSGSLPFFPSAISPSTAQLSYGGSISLYASVEGPGPIFLQWLLNGSPIPGANQANYSISNATSANAGTYTLKAINATGSALSSPVQITVAAPIALTILEQPAAQTTVQATSTNFQLSVWASGSNPMTYQWFKNGTAISGANSTSYAIPIVQTTDAGSYSVLLSNAAGTLMSNPAVVTVTPPLAPAFSNPDYNIARSGRVALGGQLSLNAPSTQVPALTTQWYFNGEPIPGATSPNLAINDFAYSNAGVYLVKSSTAGGTSTSAPMAENVQIPSYPTNAGSWLDAQVEGTVAYFVYSSPGRILRYDMSAQQWLPTVDLPSTPTAMYVATEGVYIAFGQSAYLYSLDLSNIATGTPLPNTAVATNAIFADSGYVYLSGNGNFTTVNRTGDTLVTTTNLQNQYSAEFSQVTVSPQTNVAFGWISGEEPTGLVAVSLNSDGTLSGFEQVATVGFPAVTNRTYVSPSGASIVLFNGDILNGSTQKYEGFLAGGAFDDISFLSDGNLLVVRGNQFSLYDPTSFALLGRYNASFGALKLFSQPNGIFAFSPSTTSSGTISVSTIQESTVSAATLAPATPVTPVAAISLSATPDSELMDKNGLVYLLDRIDRNILIWSPTEAAYLDSIPLTDFPDKITYSASLNRIYVDYADGRITAIGLPASEPAETAFTTVSSILLNFTAADSQLYVHLQDPYDSGDYRTLFATNGQQSAVTGWGYFGSESFWNSADQSLFEVAESDLIALPILSGAFGTNTQVSSYLQTTTVSYPFRFSPSGTSFVTGNGIIFSASTLTSQGTLAAALVDAAWVGTTIYTLTGSATGSEVCLWSGSGFTLSKTVPLVGNPLRIWTISANQLLALTATGSGPIYTLLDGSGNILSQTANSGTPTIPPVITSLTLPASNVASGSTVTLAATASGTGDSYQWEFNYANILGATSSSLTLTNVQSSNAGTYNLTVTNGYGQVTTNSFNFSVSTGNSQSLGIVTYPQSMTVLAGTTGTLSVTATGAALSYQWYFQGAPIAEAIGPTLSLPDIAPSADGNYSVTVTNVGGGSTQSQSLPASVTVVLNGNPAAHADFAGNGNSDILWQNTSTGERGVWLMNGTTFSNWLSFGDVSTAWQIAASCDFAGNGSADIVWQNSSTGERGVWLMNGTQFSSWVSWGIVPTQWQIVAVADFNGDGNPDVLWQNTQTGELGIWLMTGTTPTGWVSLGNVATEWQVVGCADFSGTGNQDILWQNNTTGERGIWAMSGTSYVNWLSLGIVGTQWKIRGTGDFNLDGSPDILWQNTQTGEIGVWLMNGTTFGSWVSWGDMSSNWQIANF